MVWVGGRALSREAKLHTPRASFFEPDWNPTGQGWKEESATAFQKDEGHEKLVVWFQKLACPFLLREGV